MLESQFCGVKGLRAMRMRGWSILKKEMVVRRCGKLNIVHQVPALGVCDRAHFSQAAIVQYVRKRALGFQHDEAHGAVFEVIAIVAGVELRSAGAWQRR